METREVENLGEVVDRMVELRIENREVINREDETNPIYLEYKRCMKIIADVESTISVRIKQASGVYVPPHMVKNPYDVPSSKSSEIKAIDHDPRMWS